MQIFILGYENHRGCTDFSWWAHGRKGGSDLLQSSKITWANASNAGVSQRNHGIPNPVAGDLRRAAMKQQCRPALGFEPPRYRARSPQMNPRA